METVLNNSQNENNKKKLIEPIEFFDTPRVQSPAEIAGMAGYLKHLYSQTNIDPRQTCSSAELKYLFAATENNDIACADMVYQIMGDNVIYSGQCYYIWNGYIWSEIGKEVFKHCVISILESRLNYVRSLQGYENLDYVESCCNNGKINSITAILQTYISKDPRLLNNDRGLLCVRNGVIDFATRRLLPHYMYKENYLTAMIDIDYEPGFRHPLFDNFIYSIMDGDMGKINYIQSVFGYATLGGPREQLCFVFKGNGANGKTTLIDAVNAVLTHNYCCTVPKNIITHENNRDINASSSTIVQLNGKRIVFTSELRKTDKIAEARFKKLIGGGRIVGREVYKQTIEFDMRATLIIDSNYLPAIASAEDDEAYAIKRRMSIIPFNHRFRPEERDINLPQKLRDPQVQKAIISWILDGVWAYLDFGLIPTPEMQYELDSYMLTENSLVQFFDNCIVNTDNPNDFIGTTELYNEYVKYCNANNLMAVTAQKFAKSDILKTKYKSDRANARGYCYMRFI